MKRRSNLGRALPGLLVIILLLSIISPAAMVEKGETAAPAPVSAQTQSAGASISQSGDLWKLENKAISAEIEFKDGGIRMTSLFNKAADREYLTGAGKNSLFEYGLIEELSSVGDTEVQDFITVDCSNAAIRYIGSDWYDMSPKPTTGDGDYFTYTFYGSVIEYHATKAYNRGITDVYIDGILVDCVDMYSEILDEETIVYANYGLSQGIHTLKAVNRHNGEGLIAMNVSHINAAYMSNRTYWAGAFSEQSVKVDDSQTTHFGATVPGAPGNSYLGGQTYFYEAGAGASYTFTVEGGSQAYVYISGTNAYNRGIVNIYIDDELVGREDMYAAIEENYPAILFGSGPLEPGEHTVRFEAAGEKNPISQGTYVPLDAIEIITVKADPEASTVTKTGDWNRIGNSAAYGTATQDDEFSVDFTDDFVQWHGMTAPDGGTADVYIDGELVDTVDLSAETGMEKILFQKADLSFGSHTLRVVNQEQDKSLTVKKVVSGRLKAGGDVQTSNVSAGDGGWSLGDAEISDIINFDEQWGKKVEIPISRNAPFPITVTLVFEIYNGNAGIRYYTFIRNDSRTDKLRVATSEILALNLPNEDHVLYHVPHQIKWEQAQTLERAKRNALCVYDSGDGWSINPENNWATSLVPGGFVADDKHTFLGLDVWHENDDVKIYTDTAAVSLVLFPEEEMEYFAVNLSVFKGDDIDGRMAVSEHLNRRFKYIDPTRRISTNNWAYGNFCDINFYKNWEQYYVETVAPAASAAGVDAVHIDDFWNGTREAFIRDSVDFRPQITEDPERMIAAIEALGLKFGIWFSPNGGVDSGWGTPDDLADPAVLEAKAVQMEETIIGKYHAQWDQIDLGIYWKEPLVTEFSHPSDSVFRKIINTRNYMEYFTNKYPDLFMQVTCEVDNPAGAQGNGLIHIPENGIIGTYVRTENGGNEVLDMFDAFGLFPMESQLMVWGVSQEYHWWPSSEWYYQFLLPRHTVIYTDPGAWTEEGIELMRTFNDWRKNERMNSILNELFRPVYTGPDNDMTGPYAWMYTNEEKTQGLVFAIGKSNTGTQSFDAQIRWLDDNKTYLVEDITLIDAGENTGRFDYRLVAKMTGAELKSEGLPIDLSSNGTRGKAYWIQEMKSEHQQVLYADTQIDSYTESWDGQELKVEVTGTPGSTGTIIVYKRDVGGTETKLVEIGKDGKGSVSFRGNKTTEPLPPVMDPNQSGQIQMDNTDVAMGYYAASGSMKAPDWHSSPIAHAYGGSQHYSNVIGSTVTISFSGTLFRWYAIRDYNRGIASIQIDNETPVDVDLYAKTEDTETQLVYEREDLASGEHTAVITVTGRRNEAVTNPEFCFVCIDYVEAERALPFRLVKAVSSGEGGTIQISDGKVREGERSTVTVTPAQGYKLKALLINNVPVEVSSGGEYVIENICGNMYVSAVFLRSVFFDDIGGGYGAEIESHGEAGMPLDATFDINDISDEGKPVIKNHGTLAAYHLSAEGGGIVEGQLGDTVMVRIQIPESISRYGSKLRLFTLDGTQIPISIVEEDTGAVTGPEDGKIFVEFRLDKMQTVVMAVADDPGSPPEELTQRTLVDSATGVTVSGKMASSAKLKVTPGDSGLHTDAGDKGCAYFRERKEEGRLLFICDIEISGRYSGDLTVSLPASGLADGTEVIWAHCNGGKLETKEIKVKDGMVSAVTDKLSPFGVVKAGGEPMVSWEDNPFTDIYSGDWFFADVKYVFENKLMVGMTDTLFAPGTNMSRSMMATVLWRMEGEPKASGDNPFTDLSSDWYREAVVWAAENEIVQGYGDGKFGPENDITREQMATMLYRYIKFKGGGFEGVWTFPLDFADAGDVSEYAYEAVCYLTMNEIVNGKPGNRFDPKGTATRGELAAILHRTLENEKL